MPVYTGIRIAMLFKQLLQIGCCFRQIFNMKGHIFNQGGGTRFAGSAYRGENTRTDGPVRCILFLFIGKLYRNGCFESAQDTFNLFNLTVKLFLCISHRFGKNSCKSPSGWVINRLKRFLIQQFGPHYRSFLHRYYSPASLFDVIEIKHCAGLERIIFTGFHGKFR